MNNSELELKDVKIIFADVNDERGYGKCITIDATDNATQKAIETWYKDCKIGKGEPKFKEYTKDDVTMVQYTFKLSQFIQIGGNGFTANDLGYGAIVNILAKAYEYDNKFGKGVTSSATAIYIKSGARQSKLDRIAE